MNTETMFKLSPIENSIVQVLNGSSGLSPREIASKIKYVDKNNVNEGIRPILRHLKILGLVQNVNHGRYRYNP